MSHGMINKGTHSTTGSLLSFGLTTSFKLLTFSLLQVLLLYGTSHQETQIMKMTNLLKVPLENQSGDVSIII